MLQFFCVDPFQGLIHDLPQFPSVVGSGQEVDEDLFRTDFQYSRGLGEFSEMIMIIPVIVVSLLERLERLVEEIPGGHPQHIHESLALAVHSHHLILDQGFKPRFSGLGFRDLRLNGFDLLMALLDALASLHPSVFIALVCRL